MAISRNDVRYEDLGLGVASAVGCGLIILTYLFFPNLRKLRYVELVFYVAINDLMASVGMALGPSENGSVECWYQGLSSTGNFLSSVFWTCLITYQVYEVVVNEGTVITRMFYVHCFCWGMPILLTFIPLTTNTYNNPDDEPTWCFVADRSDSPPWGQLFWFIASFYAWLWISMLWSTFMLVSIVLKLRRLEVVPAVITNTIGKLALYPVIITLCWTLNTVALIYRHSHNRTIANLSTPWSLVNNLGIAGANLQGFLNALVFFGVNPLVRAHWKALCYDAFTCVCCHSEVTEDQKILNDLEDARKSRLTESSEVNHDETRLNTLRNSTALPGGAHTGGNNNNNSRGQSMHSNSRSSTSRQSSKHTRLSLATEHEPDFIGTPSINSLYVHNNSSLGVNNHNNNKYNGDGDGDGEESDGRFDSRESNAPITSMMAGLKRTADGES